MKTYRNLYKKLYSWNNLLLAHQKARRGKSRSQAVCKFEQNLTMNLAVLRHELKMKTYTPNPLKTFILRDPKTRKISKSTYRDRIAHHALVNILEPIFEPRFINDSYASRKNKGTSTALKRFDCFVRRASSNGHLVVNGKDRNHVGVYVLKADIKHYFDNVSHSILVKLISKHIKDEEIIHLIQLILQNHRTNNTGKGMPLGNWTSQFFANIYLNELDQYIKHQLKAKHYLRYVDDFLIVHTSQTMLRWYLGVIKEYLKKYLLLELHPDKCAIKPLGQGVDLLGFKVFYLYRRVKRRNKRRVFTRLRVLLEDYEQGLIDEVSVKRSLQGWCGYAVQGNSYKLRKMLKGTMEQSLSTLRPASPIAAQHL
ncbi:hypothetical protein GOV07_02280 [Candidatus Woesearchaeota archaeon]|nr:hypothetical protein [Candidatus Woesearchaeota archaeon]